MVWSLEVQESRFWPIQFLLRAFFLVCDGHLPSVSSHDLFFVCIWALWSPFLGRHKSYWIKASPLWPLHTSVYFLEAPSPNRVTLGIKASTQEFGRHTNVQSIIDLDCSRAPYTWNHMVHTFGCAFAQCKAFEIHPGCKDLQCVFACVRIWNAER